MSPQTTQEPMGMGACWGQLVAADRHWGHIGANPCFQSASNAQPVCILVLEHGMLRAHMCCPGEFDGI